MKKKLLGLLLCVAMVMSVFAGCTTSKTENTSSNKSAEDAFSGDYVVNAAYVKDNLSNIKLVDSRGAEEAAKGTIKGAIATTWQYLATCEDGKTGDANWGTILDPARLSERLGALGLGKDDAIVVFGPGSQGWGAEGCITEELVAAGYSNVKFVDGGYAALTAAGIETVKGAATPVPVAVKIDSIDKTHLITTEELKANLGQYKVVDTRTDKEFNGEVLYGETKGGHIPGAIQIRFTDLFKEDGNLKSNADIEKMVTDAGITKTDKIVTYCTAGIRSAYMQMVLEMCGYKNTQNYDESYYRWCAVNEVE